MAKVPNDYHAKIRENLTNRVNLVHSYHDILTAMTGEGLLPDYAEELNDHFILVKTIELGIKQAFVVSLCGLYDQDERSLTFDRYAEVLDEKGLLPKDWEDEYRIAKVLADRLKILRNKHFAHDSLEKLTRNIWEDAGLTYNLLTELMERSENLIQKLLQADDGRSYHYGFSPKKDLAKLFPKYKPDATWIQGARPAGKAV